MLFVLLCYINNNNVNSFMCTIIGAIFFLVMLFVLLCYVLWLLLLCFSGCYINDANNILLNSFDEF